MHEHHKGDHSQHFQLPVVHPNGKGIYLPCPVDPGEFHLNCFCATAVAGLKLFEVSAELRVLWENLDVARNK